MQHKLQILCSTILDVQWIPAEPDVTELDFDEVNVAHLLRHDVYESDVRSVLAGKPRFFLNQPGRTATHLMIGPDAKGRILLIALLATERRGEWRPVTGWESRLARAVHAEYEANE
jgi:hypothetical protein